MRDSHLDAFDDLGLLGIDDGRRLLLEFGDLLVDCFERGFARHVNHSLNECRSS